MAIYKCQRCGFETDRSNNLKQHLARKILCPPTCSDISVETILDFYFNDDNKNFICECGKKYSYQSGLGVHRKKCTFKKEDVLTDRIKFLEDEVNRLKLEKTTAQQFITNNQNSNNTNNYNTINQNIHIHLTDFGKENLSHLPQSFYRECLMNGALGVLQMIEKVWFDEDHPENFNIRLSSLKNMLVQYYKHPEWEVCGFHDAIDKMIHTTQSKIVTESKIKDLECTNTLVTSLDSVQNLKPEVKRKIKDKCKGKLVNRRKNLTATLERPASTNNIQIGCEDVATSSTE